MTMRMITLVLICSACSTHGRRVQSTKGAPQEDHPNAQRALGEAESPLNALATLLLASNPEAGWQMTGTGARSGQHGLVSANARAPASAVRMEDEKKPVVIVTGGSRGLGKAIALALGAEGCRVVVNYAASAAAAEEVVEEIKKLGGDGIAVQADMSSMEGIQSLFKATAEAYEDPVSVLVNNAGITRDGLVMRMKPDQWNDVIDTNLNGVFFASQAALKVMLKKKAGRVINIASVVGKIGNIGQANYAAAKGGVIAMTMTLAREYGSRGITVNAVAPGFIESDMTDAVPAEALEAQLKNIPAGRLGKPEEVAGLVKYLALDPSAQYITGHCINIDGGIAIGTC